MKIVITMDLKANTKKSAAATNVKMEMVKAPRTKTLIVIILDESGSMQIQKNDVVRGYQNFIEQQKGITEDMVRVKLKYYHNRV